MSTAPLMKPLTIGWERMRTMNPSLEGEAGRRREGLWVGVRRGTQAPVSVLPEIVCGRDGAPT